jgi:hypothetical protein
MQTEGKMRQSGEAMRRDKTELNNIDKAFTAILLKAEQDIRPIPIP